MTAATFPDQRHGPLSDDELSALRALSEASPAPLLFAQVAQAHGSAVWLGLELLRARGWVRLRGWPQADRARWEPTPRGLREAQAHPELSAQRARLH